MQLTIQYKITNELIRIIREAITAGKIDTESIRRVILCPDDSFQKLEVYISDDWSSYFDKEYAAVIGMINISQWLDIADEALEKQHLTDPSYLISAKEIEKKYASAPPALNFGHLDTLDEAYVAFLVCLREELLLQVETGIANAAISFSQEDFHHIVGFFTHALTFDKEEKILLHGFNNPEGAGTFYDAELTVPNNKFSDHYIRFTESGFTLFCCEGTMLKKSGTESEVYSYDVSDIAFMYRKNNEIHFRLTDEFQNYILEPNRKKAVAGPPSSKNFYEAFESMFQSCPEKIISIDNIPNPITENMLFDNWFRLVLEYNVEITLKNRQTIFGYGETAYIYYLSQIPKTNAQHEPAVRFFADKLFFENRFQESVVLFDTVKVLPDFQKMHYLCALFFLDRKEEYKALGVTLETKSELSKLELMDTLWLLREPLETEDLKALKEKLTSLLSACRDNETLRLLSVVLTKVYAAMHDSKSALLQLQSVPTHETFEKIILLQELKHTEYLLHAYEKQIAHTERNAAFDKLIEVDSLDTTNEIIKPIQKTTYEHCYYVAHKIEVTAYEWVYPVSAETFIATRKENEKELIIARIRKEKSIEILQQLILPSTLKINSCVYLDGLVYLCDNEHGIVSYIVNEQAIEKTAVSFKNIKVKPDYKNFTIANGYLYASNNRYLEIYNLHTPEAAPLSDSLYIQSGYHLFIHNDLLVAGTGAGILILIDVSDKSNPVVQSTIKENKTQDNMYVAFVDNYMISQSLYNIENPSKPIWISLVEKDLAPTYFFTNKPDVPIISTGQEFLLTTLDFKNDQAVYTNWRECLNRDNWYYECAAFNFCTAYFEDSLITYGSYEIIFWKKELFPVPEQINVQEDIEKMVHTCFDYIDKKHPDFSIGKVVLEHNKLYQHIDISFHACSSLAILNDSTQPHELPIISSTFLFHSYCQEVLECQYNPMKMQFVYDPETIIAQLQHRRFRQLSARHVILLTDSEKTYLNDPTAPWKPFRINNAEKKEEKKETVWQIILSKNENLIRQLSNDILENNSLLDELLDILNKKITIPVAQGGLTNRMFQSHDEVCDIEETYEYIDNTDMYDEDEYEYEEWYCLPQYIVDPYCNPETEDAEAIEEKETLPAEYLENTDETNYLKTKSLEILCLLQDRKLVRDILFNGMQFGYLHYNLEKKEEPASESKNQTVIKYPDHRLLISYFLNNYHQMWDNFGNDTEIRSFLISNIDTFEDRELQLRIAYKYGQFSHPGITEFIFQLISQGINYNTYKGYYTGIDLSILPVEVLRPFEDLLLEKYDYFKNNTDGIVQIDAQEQLPYIYALLNKLGHEEMPECLGEKLLKAVKEQERYGSMLLDDEDYEEESAFLVALYRKAKVKRLLEYYKEDKGASWPLEEPLELYSESWNKTIEAILEHGTEIFGDTFKSEYIKRLAKNISLEDSFANDRVLAKEIIEYTYKHILKKPELASVTESLILAMHANKELFPDIIDVAALKDKNKYTLLQAAWNDLKNQDWNIAEQKADAVLVMDPAMAQAYFLKARLLWLREGIPAYLAQQEYFIEKSAHDITALARLYNLTGCALDAEERYEEALPYFKKAALNAPSDPMYIANVAEIYYKLGKSKEALQHAKSAIANGNEAFILKEIIDSKGILASL